MKIDNIIIQIIGNWIDQMQKKNWLLEEDREYYQYAMEVRLEEILTIATVFFVIICMRQFVNGLTFLVSFLTLRKAGPMREVSRSSSTLRKALRRKL